MAHTLEKETLTIKNMIWTIIIIGVGVILVRFFMAHNKDNSDLQNQTLDQKFEILVSMINDYAFNGQGTVTRLDKRSFNLYQEGQNQIINFLYGTGHLTLRWKYKYFQKEIVHERQFNDVRNLSIFEQEKIGEIIIKEMDKKIQGHQSVVLKDVPDLTGVMSDMYINAFRERMEDELRTLLFQTLRDAQKLPEMMHGVAVMQSAASFSKNLKENYAGMKVEFENLNEDFFDKSEYNATVDEITSKVLGEFIELPPK